MANIRPLSEHLALKAQTELNEVPEKIEEDLNVLKTWIGKQPHLRARTDDQFLVNQILLTHFQIVSYFGIVSVTYLVSVMATTTVEIPFLKFSSDFVMGPIGKTKKCC
ncbi:hypothetical protein DMENIID0001_056270 [Sergentomyia squamirostris]